MARILVTEGDIDPWSRIKTSLKRRVRDVGASDSLHESRKCSHLLAAVSHCVVVPERTVA
jgi:hypothetical protein